MLFGIFDIIKKVIPDSTKTAQYDMEAEKAREKSLQGAVDADVKVRLAEMNSQGIVSKWRPLAAISIFLCIFLYWFIYPLCFIIIGLFNLDLCLPNLPELPIEFYGLAVAFVSIYAYGRSIEKRK